jgi:indole-3-glycerol phosphate synthase
MDSFSICIQIVCAAHARDAKEELATGHTTRRALCDRQLKIAQTRGFLFETELQELIREFSDAYSEREIRALVMVEIRRHAPEYSQEQLVDRIIAEDIIRALERLGIERLSFLAEILC